MKLHYLCDEKDTWIFQQYHNPVLRGSALWTFILFILMGFLFSVINEFGFDNDPLRYGSYLLMGLGFFMIFNYSSCKRLSPKTLLKPKLEGEIEFSETGVYYDTNAGQCSYQWDVFVRLGETKDYLFLYMGELSAIIIRKSLFKTPDEAAQLKALLIEKGTRLRIDPPVKAFQLKDVWIWSGILLVMVLYFVFC